MLATPLAATPIRMAMTPARFIVFMARQAELHRFSWPEMEATAVSDGGSIYLLIFQ